MINNKAQRRSKLGDRRIRSGSAAGARNNEGRQTLRPQVPPTIQVSGQASMRRDALVDLSGIETLQSPRRREMQQATGRELAQRGGTGAIRAWGQAHGLEHTALSVHDGQDEMEVDIEDDGEVDVEDELVHCEHIPCSQAVPDNWVESWFTLAIGGGAT